MSSAAPHATTPDKVALLVLTGDSPDAPVERWTYSELEDAVLRVAGALRAQGFQPGSRLMIRLENTSNYAILFFGAVAAGLIALPASNQLTVPETLFLADDCGAAVLATADALDVSALRHAPRLIRAEDVREMIVKGPRGGLCRDAGLRSRLHGLYVGDDIAAKGVLHAHRAAWGRRPMYQGWYGLGSSDRMLHAGAFNWTFTLGTGLTDPWANGATAIVYTGEKAPEIWPRLIQRSEATIFAGVPGLMRQILKYGDLSPGAMPTLRHALIAGERPPETLFDEWRAATGTELYEALGMSELSTYLSSSPTVPRKPGTTGKPQAGRRVAILPVEGGTEPVLPGVEGLIAIHRTDPGLMLGYWQRPDEEACVYRGDWFLGGDLGIVDEDGYITHTGRNNDIIKALGYRVSPLEVEAALHAHPAVADVACTAIEVRRDVSVVAAFIVPKPGLKPTAEDVKAFAAERLAGYKCPREVRFVDALPRTANGKVRRASLADIPWRGEA